MFSVTYKIHPLDRCIQEANSVFKDVDIFRKPITVLKQILYNQLSQNAESYFCIRVLFGSVNILAVCWVQYSHLTLFAFCIVFV